MASVSGGVAHVPPAPEAQTSTPPFPMTAPSVFGGAAHPPLTPEAQTTNVPPVSTTTPSVSGGGAHTPPSPKAHARAPPLLPTTVPSISGGVARPPPTTEAQTNTPSHPTTAPSVYGGGLRPPPTPEAQTTAPLTPSVPDTTSGGTHAAPTPKPHAIVRPPRLPKVSGTVPRPVVGSTSEPPSYPVTGPRGRYTPAPPKVGNGTYAPVVSDSPRVVAAPCDSTVPVVNEETPKPKVISGGSTGVRTRRALGVYVPDQAKGARGVYGSATDTPDVYSPIEGALMAASSNPPNGVQTRTIYT
jgi:hypothetical protein